MQQKHRQQCKKNFACYLSHKSQKANNLFEKVFSNTNVVYICNAESSTNWSAEIKRIFKWAKDMNKYMEMCMCVHMYDPEVKNMEKNTEGYTITAGVWKQWEKKTEKKKAERKRMEEFPKSISACMIRPYLHKIIKMYVQKCKEKL